jgi:DNA-binding NarL/FixJ family response regulator
MQKILIVEDNQHIREWWLEKLVDIFPGAEVASTASLKGARELCSTSNFSLALIDLGLPDGSGIDLLAELSVASPMTYCVVTTIFDDDEHIFQSLRNGAKGYLIKDQTAEKQLEQLHEITIGQPPLSPSVARRILGHFTGSSKADAHLETSLTKREREVLALLAKGRSRPQIASELDLAVSTVCGYTKSIYQKLEISSQAEAAIKASRIGLIPQA